MIGYKTDEKKIIHLIDFGLACAYLDKEEKHIPFKKYPHIAGTLYYLSVYGHLGIQATRRDDFISLGFMLVHLFKGQLPWLNMKNEGDIRQIMKEICKMKATLFFKTFCDKLPEEFIEYFEYILKLSFIEKPDYAYLKKLFPNLFLQFEMEVESWLQSAAAASGFSIYDCV